MCSLLLAAIPGLTIQPLGRGVFVRSAAAAAAAATVPPAFAEDKFVAKRATDVAQVVGTGGLSSYNEMKLKNALKELADAPVPADIKRSVDEISTTLPLITQSQVPNSAQIAQATDAIANLVLTAELQTQAASLVKQSTSIRTAIGKGDANAAAIAATALTEEMTEFCYSYEGAQKPLAELRNGSPAVFDRERTKIDLPVSGKTL